MTTTPFEIDIDQGTGSTGVELPRTPTTTMATLTRQYGMLRDRTSILDADVGNDHRATQLRTLELLARDRAREDVATLLEEISTERGLGWSDIARLVGVSVQAVRKWRRQEPVSGENRLAVARLAALLDLLSEIPVHDAAGWLEIPVLEGYALRHLDLYRLNRADLLFDLAHLRITPQSAMNQLTSDWRERYRLDHEVYEAEDGQRSIRRLR
ncbi:MAG: hypothetical protein M3O70_18600 [Actinomycetota bacterium]|nr:hypothetical protein [Actinomycetota bacterium]